MSLEGIIQRFNERQRSDSHEAYNIVMLGTSSVGKTVFMTTMFHDLIHGGLKGLRLRSSDSARDKLLLNDYRTLCSGAPLPGTARYDEWHFKVSHNETDLFAFHWIDYRGAAVNPKSDFKTNPYDLPSIENLLQKDSTFAVFVLADAERATNDLEAVREELEFCRAVLETAISADRKRPLQLVLILTKVDAVALKQGFFGRSWKRRQMRHLCEEVFDDIFKSYLSAYPETECWVIPVSSYGTSSRKIKGTETFTIRPGTSRLDSFQIHLPLLKSLHFIMRYVRTRHYAKYLEQRELASKPVKNTSGKAHESANAKKHRKEIVRDLREVLRSLERALRKIDTSKPDVYYKLD